MSEPWVQLNESFPFRIQAREWKRGIGVARRLLQLLILVCVVGAAFYFTRHVFRLRFAEPILTGPLTSLQEKEIDAYLGGVSLLTTLATLVFGGVAFYFDATRHVVNRKAGILLIGIGALLAGTSIFFGYYAGQAIVWMLASNFFNLDNPIVAGFRLLQVTTFLVALGCFCLAFLSVF